MNFVKSNIDFNKYRLYSDIAVKIIPNNSNIELTLFLWEKI